MQIHGGVVKGVATPLVVGAVAFVAVKRFVFRHPNPVDENDEEEEEEEKEQRVSPQQPPALSERRRHRAHSHFSNLLSLRYFEFDGSFFCNRT